MKRLLVAASLFALFIPASAFAQQDAQTTDEVTEYEFKDWEIKGQPQGPEGMRFRALPSQRGKALYKARPNWVPELLESTREI